MTGCGSAQPGEDPETARREAERAQLMREEPEAPYRVVRRRAFRPPQACGQGPYRIRFDGVGANYGEDFSVYACTPRELRGDFRLTRSDRAEDTESRSFGYSQDNRNCVASATEVASHGNGSGGGSSAPRGRPASRGGSSAAPRQRAARLADLPEVRASADCPEGQHKVHVINQRGFISYDGRALQEGVNFTLELWSTQPNDLRGVTFVLEQRAVAEDMTRERWREYNERYREWVERYRAFSDREVASGRSHYVDSRPQSADPPPAARRENEPPRPSTHAEWIAGYWHRGNDGWVWMAGFWRVPESDVRARLTQRAPTPPPRARAEPAAQQARPSSDAVWTAGNWQWGGHSYVWVPGAWRVPPTANHQWRAPTWSSAGAGAVFVPGGWTISLGH